MRRARLFLQLDVPLEGITMVHKHRTLNILQSVPYLQLDKTLQVYFILKLS
jgi:hypothetical protein